MFRLRAAKIAPPEIAPPIANAYTTVVPISSISEKADVFDRLAPELFSTTGIMIFALGLLSTTETKEFALEFQSTQFIPS